MKELHIDFIKEYGGVLKEGMKVGFIILLDWRFP